MTGRWPKGEYVGLGQQRSQVSWRRPWELLPEPVTRVALRGWRVLPAPVRHALVPLGHVINPGHTTRVEQLPGPLTVPGVAEARAAGFTPIEDLTGFVGVALVWPDEHRRSVPETRNWWLDEPLDGKLWLVRPPWPNFTLDEVLTVLWSEADEHRDEQTRVTVASETLRWSEQQAQSRLSEIRRRQEEGSS